MVKPHVDKETCIGCEVCVNKCPEIFEMEDDGLAVAKDVEISDDLMESANSAKDGCPVEAISIN